MSLDMASLRRYLLRKKRFFLLVLFCCITFIFFSSLFRTMFGSGYNPPAVPVDNIIITHHIEPRFNVLEPPRVLPNESSYKEKQNRGVSDVDLQIRKTTASIKTVQENRLLTSTKVASYNKTEDIEIVKNKTLSQMGVLGRKENINEITSISYIKQIWDLSVSFEDIGNIMKDTSFLNKLKPLNLSGPMLTSTQNRTSNFSLSMPLKMGYCDCWEHHCSCCVQLVNTQLHLHNKTCANFSFVSKSHELNFTFSIDSKIVYKGVVSADAPPMLCMGSKPAVADMCVHFFNMTYKVDGLALHKSQIFGCTDMSLNIYNKTISVFPVDCFQIPGDANHHPKEENMILPNFVP